MQIFRSFEHSAADQRTEKQMPLVDGTNAHHVAPESLNNLKTKRYVVYVKCVLTTRGMGVQLYDNKLQCCARIEREL